jgi:DNA (cytosine-5)-methyltransferase 1
VKIVEPVYGIYTGVSEDFQRGPLKNMSRCLKANTHDASVIYQEPIIVASRGRNPQNPSDRTSGNHVEQRLEPNSEGICNTLTSVQKDNYLLEPTVKIKQATSLGYAECKIGGVADLSFPSSTTRRGRVQDGGDTCPTLMITENGIYKIESPYRIRKLTPRECWRLMDFTDLDFFSAMLLDHDAAVRLLEKYEGNSNGTAIMREAETMQKMSNTQLYKEAGNSIVRAVLVGIFKQMF